MLAGLSVTALASIIPAYRAAASPGPLRLAPLTRAKVGALCELFCRRESLRVGGELPTTWRFAPAAAGAETSVMLHGAHEPLALSLAEDGLREPLGVREWWDYAGESRLLAFSIAHGVLLDALGQVLQDRLVPRRWSRLEDATPDDSLLSLDFVVAADDGRSSRGVLELSPVTVSRLAAQPGWQPPGAAALAAWGCLPGVLCVHLPAVSLPWSELRAAEAGDVLVVGAGTHCWRNLRLAYPGFAARCRSWPARYHGSRLEVTGQSMNESTEATMSDPAPQTPEDARTAAAATAVEALPIILDFEVASLPVSLGELAAVRPGYVFQLTQRLEDARVVIRANGACVGQGRLVAVGDTLAVQLLELDTRQTR